MKWNFKLKLRSILKRKIIQCIGLEELHMWFIESKENTNKFKDYHFIGYYYLYLY